MLNADVEPTATFSVVEAKPRKGGKVLVTVDLPNAGLVTAGDKNAKLATAAGKGKGKSKSKVKYLKRADTQVSAPGQAALVVRPTKTAKQTLAAGGRLKAKLKLRFTPTGGNASTQVIKVKLKP